MTRKRFTKLLMAGGWSPRAAQAWAGAAQGAGLAYGPVFHDLESAGVVEVSAAYRLVSAAVEIIVEVFKAIVEAIRIVAAALVEWCEGVGRALAEP